MKTVVTELCSDCPILVFLLGVSFGLIFLYLFFRFIDSESKLLKILLFQHTALALGASISILFLITFFLLQYYMLDLLRLETRWLIVSGVPLLIALFIGGYIKSFKGFGVELESSLSKPVSNIELTATEAMEQIYGDAKRSTVYLHSIKDKRKISRLILFQGRRDFYSSRVLIEYLDILTGLKYIEIRSHLGQFIALMPVSYFKVNNEVNHGLIDEFLFILESSDIRHWQRNLIVTDTVQQDADLLEALKLMRRKNINKLVVIDEDGIFIGLLLLRSVERVIINTILSLKDNK